MRPLKAVLTALALASCATPQTRLEPGPGSTPPPTAPPVEAPPPAPPPGPPPAPAAQSLSLPEASGIEEANLDRTVDPCDDFYQFACGGWQKRTEIPGDHARWGSFAEIDERNLVVLRRILEDDAAGKGNKSDAYADKLGNFYAACMDEAKIEANAAKDLKAELARLDKVKDAKTLVPALARIHLGIGNAMFDIGSEQDAKDATRVIARLDQGGLGLPDRDYYLKEEPRFQALRQAYTQHVAKMLKLAGTPADRAAKDADAIFAIEKQLAQASLTRVERRDPKKTYNRIELAGIEGKAPAFPWKAYFKEMGRPDLHEINVAVPEFFVTLDGMLKSVKMDDWRTYLRWHVIKGAAPRLSKAFVDETFDFYGKTLNGTKELPPRWKRCVNAADHALGEALGQPFVRETFGADGKERTLAMIHLIEQAMREDLTTLQWMDDATRRQALTKLERIANKIGYPDKWRNYDALKLGRDSHLQNHIAAATFETHRDLDKIGKPLDRGEWLMSPPAVNAYYEPAKNEIVFPAGILQPPFYIRQGRRATNFGAIGMVMGHELTHGFDDEGRQYDEAGNLRDWWTPSVNQEFERRASCVVKQFDGYTVVDDQTHLNGKLTLGENLADLGGLKLAYRALQLARQQQPAAETATTPGQFSDDQLFFLGAAQAWCAKTRPENARLRVVTDPHSPPEYRIDGPFSNLSDFARAYQCKPGSRMVRADACVVW